MEKDPSCELKTKHRKDLLRKSKKLKNSRTKVTQPRLPKTAEEVSSNWKALLAVLATDKKPRKDHKRKRTETVFSNSKSKKGKPSVGHGSLEQPVKHTNTGNDEIWFDNVDPEDIEKVTGKKSQDSHLHEGLFVSPCKPASSTTSDNHDHNSTELQIEPRSTKCVGLDCEFVGIGKGGAEHMLARVSLVNSDGDVLYDQYVAPQERVVDYRTDVSGVRPSDLRNAPSFAQVQEDVAAIMKNKTLIGHSIATDLKVLLLDHPRKHIRDTAKYKPFQQRLKTKYPSLKKLSSEVLSISIQTGEHSSVEDARATMQLYQVHRKEWEKSIKDKFKKK